MGYEQHRPVVRPATLNDAEAVRSVGLQTWPSTYSFAGEDYIRSGLERWWSAAVVERGIADTVTVVAEVEGEVVGMGNLDLRQDPAVVWKLYVLPEHQGTGAGSALMDTLRDGLPEGRDTVTLAYVDGNERAAEFYARKGFVVTGRESSGSDGHPDRVWTTWRR